MLCHCLQPLASKTELGQPITDEHLLLDDNKYIADIMYELRANKQKEFAASKLLFKKRMFRETDETITEPQFVNLSYVQAQHDYLQVRQPSVHFISRPAFGVPCQREQQSVSGSN